LLKNLPEVRPQQLVTDREWTAAGVEDKRSKCPALAKTSHLDSSLLGISFHSTLPASRPPVKKNIIK
jgi:hypothetical protein